MLYQVTISATGTNPWPYFGMMGNYGRDWNTSNGCFGPGWGMMGYGYGPQSWFGLITMALIWVILALAIAALIKWLRK